MQTIKNILVFSALSFLLFISGLTVPLTGIVFLPLSSVSIVLLFIKSGILSGVVGAGLSVLALYRFIPVGNIFPFAFVLFIVLNALFLYSGIAGKRNSWQTIVKSCVAVSFVSIAAMQVLIHNGFQISWVFDKMVSRLPKDISGTVQDILAENIYSLIVIYCMGMVTLSYIFLSSLSARFDAGVKKLQSFAKWRLPEGFIFAFICSLLFYVGFRQLKADLLYKISENMLNVVLFIYFVCGLSIGSFFFSKSKMMLILSYILFFLYSPAAIFLGVADVWVNFRKKREVKKVEP